MGYSTNFYSILPRSSRITSKRAAGKGSCHGDPDGRGPRQQEEANQLQTENERSFSVGLLLLLVCHVDQMEKG